MNRKASKGTHMNTRHPLWRKITLSLSLALVLSLLFASPTFADIKVRVEVTDYCSGLPIEGARVEVTTSKADLSAETEAITGPDGKATIDPVRPGPFKHTVRVTKDEYEPAEVTRQMEAWTEQELLFELTPIGGCPPLPEPPPCQLYEIILDPPEVDMQVGEQQLFWCAGQAADGAPCDPMNPLWEVSSGGTLDPACQGSTSCTYTATKEGHYTITCTQDDIWGTADAFQYAYKELAQIDLDPSEVHLDVGGKQEFTATGLDLDGNDYPLINPTWTASGGGTLDPACQGNTSCPYTATTPGEFTLTCSEPGTTIEGTAYIDITEIPPCRVNRIIMHQPEVDLKVGEKQTFKATGLDLDGNPCDPMNPLWTASAGDLDPACQGSTSCPYTPTEPGDQWLECWDGDTDIYGRTEFDVLAAELGGEPCPAAVLPLAGIGMAGLVIWRRRPAGKR